MHVVAERAETEDISDRSRGAGRDAGQGKYLGA
jgi:EAL domain-containing protein (putative c-di-GMP-specific phosphodiesterase class I)